MKEVFELLPEAIRGQIRILFQRVWQTIGKEKSTRSLLDNIGRTEDMGFIPSRNASFALYKGSMCYADSLNYANINFDGSVYRCTANEYRRENRFGYLNDEGEIVWEHKELLDRLTEKATFDNEMCLKCKNLAICGGLCFNRRMNHLLTGQLACVKSGLDTGGVGAFLKEYYAARLKRRKEYRAETA